ncbi:hypothetical protein KR222_008002 [Zaprionus bogoriensis]|nr:hypothetical protein KR222_008002 [Zaprionus bogoriensis]
MSTTANGQRQRVSRMSKRAARRSSQAVSAKTSLSIAEEPPRVLQQRVFLYMQLNDILNLPVASYPLELHLYHIKNTLQKMTEHYTKETIIYEHEFDKKGPAFAMTVIQDSIEDMNMFSDNPLVVSLYQRIPRHRKGELKTVRIVRTEASMWTIKGDAESRKSEPNSSDKANETEANAKEKEKEKTVEDELSEHGEDDDYVEESLEFISRGHCDLLQLFHHKRFISNISIMLYPEYNRKLQTPTTQKITTTSEWHMYSIIPILKNFHFSNLAFITLESIYNAPPELHERAGYLGISLSLRAIQPTGLGVGDAVEEVLPLCTFYGFVTQIIQEQNTIIVWENIKRDLLKTSRFSVSNNQMDTNFRIKLPHLFRMLLMTQGVDMRIDEIDTLTDSALINNSMHRYVLTSEMRAILEASLQHNQYEILLQLYDEIPANVLYEGVINPSIFGYPDVNSCRFASVLASTTRLLVAKEKLIPKKPMFAILKICFFHPLTKPAESLDSYNESQLKTARLRRCNDLGCLQEMEPEYDILKEVYRNFDELIKNLIGFIIKNEVSCIEDQRSAFCCHLDNLRDLLVEICAWDFNKQMPTKNNIEFREMLTHMHKALMERIDGLVTCCAWDSQSNCIVNHESEEMRTRRLIEEYRTMCIVGECVMAKQLFAEIKEGSSNKLLLNFYVFLNSVENLNFEAASNYVINERASNWNGDYFVSLLKLYVDYQREQLTESRPGEAFSNMMEQLRIFAAKNNVDREVWILLYCYYKAKRSLPGMEYSRWKYENLVKIPAKPMPIIPLSMYENFLLTDFKLSGKMLHGTMFYEVFKTFARLGAYGFAEVVFAEIAGEFSFLEVYLVTTTLKMLQGQINNNMVLRNYPMDRSERGKLLRYYQASINGNVEYYRERYDEAIGYYKELLELTASDTDLLPDFYVSLLRLGRLCFENGDYEVSQMAYELCVPFTKKKKNFLANYGMGLTLYYVNRLEDAVEYLACCTDNGIFMADPWGFLAVINLRLGRNKAALDCWKIAKMYPEIRLNNRIYAELEKIQYSTVCLLVENDCKLV